MLVPKFLISITLASALSMQSFIKNSLSKYNMSSTVSVPQILVMKVPTLKEIMVTSEKEVQVGGKNCT